MKKHLFKQLVSVLLILCMVLAYAPTAGATGTTSVTWEETDQKITAEPTNRLLKKEDTADHDPSKLVRVSIALEEPSTVGAGYTTMGIASNPDAMAYQNRLLTIQKRMERTISLQALGGSPLDVVWNMTLVGNIISAWVPYDSLEKIAAIHGVKEVAMEAQYEPAVAQYSENVIPTAYSSSSMIGSGTLWDSGYTGAGTRIAIIDTGIDTGHQSFDNNAYLYALRQNAKAKGMSYEEYIASLDLLDAAEISAVLPKLHVSACNNTILSSALYRNEKLAFGFNYVDGNLNIDHMQDTQGEHGSHVAGITSANRYIPQSNGSYIDALDSVLTQGVAPDAQLITMKVFGEKHPYDSDYMAAIEDAILLGCDAINLSMGSNHPGAPYTDIYNGLMEMLKSTDTVVSVSAGNNSTWASNSLFGSLYNDDVNFNTVGAPGSYESAFTVASVENDGTVNFFFEVAGQKAFYRETLGFGNTSMVTLDTSSNQTGTEYEYIFIDGLGEKQDYTGIDVTGKIVIVSRGSLNFATKANNALSLGAIGVVVYNNVPGINNMDLTGLHYAAPVVSITQAEGAAIRAVSENKGTHHTGKLTVYGKMSVSQYGAEYYTMNSFSSWGGPGNLTLKPEITAPGGNIYSVYGSNPLGGGTDQYVTQSGTSMAAPQISGMTALLAQHYKENDMAAKSGLSYRHLAQSLLMSTATPLREEAAGGTYYSILNQGAGLARVDLAANAESYVLVKGQDDGKVKAELGDDPHRTGIYTFDFTITNMSAAAHRYALRADLFRQDIFEYSAGSNIWMLDTGTTNLDANVTFSSANMHSNTSVNHDLNGDGVTNTLDADYLAEYAVGNPVTLNGNGDLNGDGQITSYDAHLLLASLEGDIVTVPAMGTASVTVTMKLTNAAKAELDAQTPKGTYIEAFVYAESIADSEGNVGTTHSIPMLAFYGDWSEPSMFDRGTYAEILYKTVSTAPYLYDTGFFSNTLLIDYGNDKEYYYCGNPIVDDSTYLPQRNAFSSTNGSIMTEQTFSLIRSAGDSRLQILNAESGEVYFEHRLGELQPTYYNPSGGTWENTTQSTPLNWQGTDAAGQPLPEGTKVTISLTAVSHYYRQADGSYIFEDLGSGSTLTTSLTIDNTAPEAINIDLSKLDNNKLIVTAKDNEYVAAVSLLNASGTRSLNAVSPNQQEKNKEVTVELDLNNIYGNRFLVAVFDYANNMKTYQVELHLSTFDRDYFTAYDYQFGSYVNVSKTGAVSKIIESGLSSNIRAMEYVGGYVFSVTDDNNFCVAYDKDLSDTQYICKLDKDSQWQIANFNDLAYNHADGKLYGQFYSKLNSKAAPYLCTIDMHTGKLNVICELPENVNSMAIDGNGNFYSTSDSTIGLYTYTLAQVSGSNPSMTYVGKMGAIPLSPTTLAWDHNENKLYAVFSNTLMEINPKTAEGQQIGYLKNRIVGLYITPTTDEGLFDPVNTVTSVELNHGSLQVPKGSMYTLEPNVWPWNSSDRTVTWKTSNASVATVNAKGTVTGVGEGNCVITATSTLDHTKTASCNIEVISIDTTLNGLVWDENGEIWMSKFTPSKLPEYTKISDTNIGNNLSSATIGQDGNIYAASLDMDTLHSKLYKLDPTTFTATLIGACKDGYMDLAPAPGQPGNTLMAVYGGNVLNVDATTGDYYNHYYMFSNSLVALAYVGTDYDYTEWGFDTQVDWYFLIDRVGYVYLLGFLEQDGVYYYLEHDQLAPGGIYTKLDFEMDTTYYGSAYFDGERLYYSAYKESKNKVVLMAINVIDGSRAGYEIGTFADGVWPVVGLMDLSKTKPDNHIGLLNTTAEPIVIEPAAEFKDLSVQKADGSLNSIVSPMSISDVKNNLVSVYVTLPDNGTNADMTVSFDTGMLELVDVDGSTTAFAWKENNNKIRLSLAEASTINTGTTVARLTFKPIGQGKTTVSIVTNSLGANECNHNENVTLYVSLGNSDTNFVDVSPSAFYYEPVLWAVDNGITAGYGNDYTFAPDLACTRGQVVTFLWRTAGEPEPTSSVNPFTDIQESDYFYKAVLWAVEEGITNGYGNDYTFAPNIECNRGQIATFLWRYFDEHIPASSNNPFTDVAENAFYYNAVLWAVEQGITNGYGNDYTFAPELECNRGQVVTFLYRAMN